MGTVDQKCADGSTMRRRYVETYPDQRYTRELKDGQYHITAWQLGRSIAGDITTNFIAEEYPGGFHPGDVPHKSPALVAAVAAAIHRRHIDREATVDGQLPGNERIVPDEWVVRIGAEAAPARARLDGAGGTARAWVSVYSGIGDPSGNGMQIYFIISQNRRLFNRDQRFLEKLSQDSMVSLHS